MGAIAFLVLFILGFVLAATGFIVSLVDAFRVSPGWGLLALLIPVIGLVLFGVKFWGRKWARNGLILFLGGIGTMLLSSPLRMFTTQRAGDLGASPDETMPAQIPIEPLPMPNGEADDDQEFAEPLVPVAPQLSPMARADLIQSTDANERLQQISDGRTDPFATVPIPPPPQIVPPPPPAGTAPGAATPAAATPPGTAPTPGAPAAPGTTAAAPGTPVPGTPGAPGATAPRPTPGATPGAPGTGQPATPPPLAPLPALPQPALAEAVQVTGVMTIGNENFAVLQTAAGSQYVRVGQRVSNGQVLVKRINMRGSEPIVVLEENGIEVSRPVGAPATTAEPSA
ncbi:MAG: hypothetical protein EA368_18660 [Leptolyngbya sp. DLM2.Bin27]|nr:MAG: hypothetical protein EA368_18660 [Leptolyngbya sp. DLM2.Bin27]